MGKYNPLAIELNEIIEKQSPTLFSLLSELGKRIFFPKGVITQSNEAKKYAKAYDATIGIATQNKKAMSLACVQDCFSSDFDPDELFPYAPSRGVTKLREFWKDKIKQENPKTREQSFGLPIITTGISHGLSIVGELFFNPGDIVISPDKYWGNYRFLWIAKLGVDFQEFPMLDNELKRFNFEEFERMLSRHVGKKQNIIFNFPNNPTGYSLTSNEAAKIRETLIRFAKEGSKFVVICDDAYFGMVWEDHVMKESLFSYLADAHENIITFKVDGATKEGFMWGFRIGFITSGMKGLSSEAYEALETKIAGSIRSTISNSSLPAQNIMLKAFNHEDFQKQIAEKKIILKDRYLEIKKHTQDPRYSQYWDVYACQSGYFICLRLKGVEAEPLRKHLLMKYGVGVVSSARHDIRIAYSCLEKEHIAEMVLLTSQAVKDLQVGA